MAAIDDLTELVERAAAVERTALSSKWKDESDVHALIATVANNAEEQRQRVMVDDHPLPVTPIQAAFGVPVSEMRPIPGRHEPPAGEAAATEIPPKFSAPVATQVIDRPRLRARLTDGWQAGTTLLAATAGWGKTLLVSSWIAAGDAGPAVAWVSLDRADDDERIFWRTLAAALLSVADGAASDDLRGLTRAEGVDPASGFAGTVRRLRQRFVLVLDNLHEVRSPAVHAGLLRLVERPLPTLSLVVTSRRDPPWPLQRLRLAGLLREVRATDLAFRNDEAAALFANLGLDLTASQVDRLVRRTDGWAAGLRLAAVHLLSCEDIGAAVDTFSGDDHSVAGYLLTEVLDQQAGELIAFLERISVVDLVCAGLADALTGDHDGEARLAELAASLLFVEAVGRPGRWYRLHRLIADILRARPMPLRQRRDLYRRAAEWFRDQDNPLDAVQAALQGGLWPLAAELVGKHVVPLVLQGNAHRLERLLTSVPRSAVLGRPELAAGLAAARVAQGITTEVGGLIEAARTGATGLPRTGGQRVAVMLDLVAASLDRLSGDLDAAAAIFQRVPQEPAELARLGLTGTEIFPVVVLGNLGTAKLWSGDLQHAGEHLTAAADLGSDGPTLPHLNAAAQLALLHCERGDLVAAEAAAREVTATAARLGWAGAPQTVSAYLAMARVLLDRDELTDLDGWLQRIADVESVGPEPHVRLAAALLLAVRRDAVGDRERALSGLRATYAQLEPWTPPRGLAEQWILSEAMLLARLGDLARARAQLDTMGEPRTGAGAVGLARVQLILGEEPTRPLISGAGPRVRLGAELVDAISALAHGAEEQALVCLENALLTAAPNGLRRPFLTDADELRALLHERVARGSAATAFALDVLQRMPGGTVDDVAARRALVDPLTERELTILRYLGSSLSNAEIASELYVSVNTVKTHQRAVYRKLEAAGRRDAVRRARALHLL